MENEIWLSIKDYEDRYQVSNFGRVRYIGNKPNWKRAPDGILTPLIVKQKLSKNGYNRAFVRLYNEDLSQCKNHYIHRLVAQAFIGPVPQGKIIDHIDRNPTNNYYKNLRYINHQQNALNRTIKGCIFFKKSSNKWISIYQINKTKYYKQFKTKEECEDYHIEIYPVMEAIREELCEDF